MRGFSPSTCRASSRAIRRSWCRTWSAPTASGRRIFSIRSRRRTARVIGGLSRNNGLAQFYDVQQCLGSVRRPQIPLARLAAAGNRAVRPADPEGRQIDRRSQEDRGRRVVDRRAARRPRSIRACSMRSTAPRSRWSMATPARRRALLAVERNEVDGHVSGGSSAAFRARIAPWLKKLRQGDPADGHDPRRGISRHPDRDRDHADRRGQAIVRDRLRRAGDGPAVRAAARRARRPRAGRCAPPSTPRSRTRRCWRTPRRRTWRSTRSPARPSMRCWTASTLRRRSWPRGCAKWRNNGRMEKLP